MAANTDKQRGNHTKDYGKTLAVLLYRRKDGTLPTNFDCERFVILK